MPAPETRKTHITRIVGTNKDGDVLSDIWVDVERMDVIKPAMQVQPKVQWQGMQRKLRWCDDPDGDDYEPDGPPSRTIEILKVCDPNSDDIDDPDEWVPIKVIKAARSRVETGTADNGGGGVDRFVNNVTDSELNQSRVVEVRRIPHYDTSIDDDAKAAFDADPTRKEYVVTVENYTKDTSSKDDEQYVLHEIITYLKHKGNHNDLAGQQGRQTKLLNQYLIDESDDPKGDEVFGSSNLNPPYRLDPFQNIVNVNFGGLAVEFDIPGRGTSDIILANGIGNMSKVIISLWFRIPQDTIDAVRDDFNSSLDRGINYSVFNGVIPIITWGPQQTGTIYEFSFPVLTVPNPAPGPPDFPPFNFTLGFISGNHASKTPPSYIGINVASPDIEVLEVNIQTANKPSCEATNTDLTNVTISVEDGPIFTSIFTRSDISFSDGGTPEYFGNADYNGDGSGAGSPRLSNGPDHWHHILLSYDVSPGCATVGYPLDSTELPGLNEDTVTTYSKMWCALDDVNLEKGGLPAIWVGDDVGDANGIVSAACAAHAGQPYTREITFQSGSEVGGRPEDDLEFLDLGIPSVTLGSPSVPSDQLGLPAGLLPNIQNVELGELQIWVGQTLDAGKLVNRRLFVGEDGKPVKPSIAQQALGTPTILLHGSGNWKSGTNTGSFNQDFKPDGTIKRYRPDPSLRGPQSPK